MAGHGVSNWLNCKHSLGGEQTDHKGVTPNWTNWKCAKYCFGDRLRHRDEEAGNNIANMFWWKLNRSKDIQNESKVVLINNKRKCSFIMVSIHNVDWPVRVLMHSFKIKNDSVLISCPFYRFLSWSSHRKKKETACLIHAWQLAPVTCWTTWLKGPLSRSSAVTVCRLMPALRLEQNSSIGFRKGEYGGRYKHL
jgi:hypothetical protein